MGQALVPGDPTQVGRYRLRGRLGQGGMGQVYLAQSPGGRLVAVKLIRPELASDPEFRVRFAREVATARTVGGIFTVPVVDADVDGPQPWLVTAFVEGPSLADAVNDQGPLALGTALTLAAGLAEGLEMIHAAGVVHRDLKPSNILLAADGPRIIDFGISRAADGTGLTRTGWVSGSPSYMSPEQAEGHQAGPASDVFSLGSVIAYAVTGREPFGSGPPAGVLYRVVHGQPDTRDVPMPIRPLVEWCLAKAPEQRPTASQIIAELDAAAPAARPPTVQQPRGPLYQPTITSLRQPDPVVGVTWPTSPPNVAAAPARRRRRSPSWAVSGAVLALALIGVGVLAVRHFDATRTHLVTQRSTTEATSKPTVAPAWAGWHAYRDLSGFSIKLPPGWAVSSRTGTEVQFTGPTPGFVALVAWTTTPQPDQLTDWRQQAAAKAAADPSYQQIGIERVHYRGYNAADWEFTNLYQGALTHVLDRGFIVRPGRLAYAIELYGPDASWTSVRSGIWNGLLATFTPAGQ
jgi:serine/threonine protein kinase